MPNKTINFLREASTQYKVSASEALHLVITSDKFCSVLEEALAKDKAKQVNE